MNHRSSIAVIAGLSFLGFTPVARVVSADDLFAPWQLHPTGSIAWDVETGDFDNDGKLDMASAIQGNGPVGNVPPGILVFAGNGDGTFDRCDMYSGGGVLCLVSGDFNANGFPEILLPFADGWHEFFQAPGCVASGPGCLNHWPSVGYALGFMNAASMDGDSLPDIVTGSNGHPGTLTVFLNGGTPCFNQQVDYPLGARWIAALETVDLTGDGADEVICVYGTISRQPGVIVYRNDGSGALTLSMDQPIPYSGNRTAMDVGDLTGDGKADLAVADITGQPPGTLLFTGDGLGGFGPPKRLPTGGPAALLIHDVTGDDVRDLIIADRGSYVLKIFPGPITASLGTSIDIPIPGQPFGPLLTGDLNSDGLSDLMLVQYGGIGVLLAEATTAVSLLSFSAGEESGRPVVRWRVSEDAIGSSFSIQRQIEDHGREIVDHPAWSGRLVYEYVDDEPAPGTGQIRYWLEETGRSGRATVHGPVTLDLSPGTPSSTSPVEIRPNPFEASTTIYYALTTPGSVHVEISDVEGRNIVVLVDEWQGLGSYAIPWDGHTRSGRSARHGTYFARLTLPDSQPITRKITLAR